MRYYQVDFFNPDGSSYKSYSSLNSDGSTNVAALCLELEANVGPFATPIGDSSTWIRVWNPPLEDVSTQKNFNGKAVKIFGGMQRGLPLANPGQAGLLVQGVVNQAFSNWIGPDQSLEMIVIAGDGSPTTPKNIVMNWAAGSQMGDAARQALATAFSDYSIVVSVSNRLTLPSTEAGFFDSASQFSAYLNDTSRSIIRSVEYLGVSIHFRGKTIYITDGTGSVTGAEKPTVGSTAPKDILFTDLIGQPTWIGPAMIQLTTVLRGDIGLSDFVKLPQTQVTNTPQAFSQFRDNSVFQGTWIVNEIRHLGNSRQPDADAWVSTFNVSPAAATPAAT